MRHLHCRWNSQSAANRQRAIDLPPAQGGESVKGHAMFCHPSRFAFLIVVTIFLTLSAPEQGHATHVLFSIDSPPLHGAALPQMGSEGAVSLDGEVVIDNSQAETTGTWTPSTYKPGYYGANYVFHRSGTGSNAIAWRPQLVDGGDYDVYFRLPDGAADRAPDAVFTVHHQTGVRAFIVDERVVASGAWRLLGRFSFASGSTGYVDVTDRATGTYVIADAVKFVRIETPLSPTELVVDNMQAEVSGTWTASTYRPGYYGANYVFHRSGTGTNTIIWRPSLAETGEYDVYFRLPDGLSDRAPDARFSVHQPTGTRTFVVDERVISNGAWKLLDRFVFASGSTAYVELTDGASGTYVIGDAVKFVKVATTPPSVLSEIVVDNTTATVAGAWSTSTFMPNYLGANYLAHASGGTGSNWVRWTPRLTESGRYFVYYRLPDGAANRAPDAPFAVTSDGGDTDRARGRATGLER